jgi:hypothetical protein
MRSHLVIVCAPPLELLAHIGDVEEDLHVQAFIAQPAIKRFYVAVLDRSAWADEV